jgi:outer membrane protein
MKMKHIALCAVLGMGSMAAYAQDGVLNNSIAIGYADLTIHSDSGNLTSNGPAFLTPPAGLRIDSAQTLMIDYVRRIDERWDAEVALGLPPKHDVRGTGALAPYGVLAKVKQAGPTFFLNYKFGSDSDKLRPYVGVGLNYTRFYDGESTAANNLAAGGPTQIRLKDSFGYALQTGLNYHLDQRWHVHAGIVVADVETDLTATTGSIARKTHIDFRPIVYTVGVGYSF